MSCCADCDCRGVDKFFSRWSKKYAKRYRRKGLEKVQEYLLEGIRNVRLPSPEVLDIGCGVGALHFALLKGGAARATGVDAAEGMLREARATARDSGLEERTSYFLGDFARIAPEIPEADVTTLDKVVCCYEHLDALLDRSLRKTRRIYALSYPRERLTVRWVFHLQIFAAKLFRAAFRPYWHDWSVLRTTISGHGFRSVYENQTFWWSVAVFERT